MNVWMGMRNGFKCTGNVCQKNSWSWATKARNPTRVTQEDCSPLIRHHIIASSTHHHQPAALSRRGEWRVLMDEEWMVK